MADIADLRWHRDQAGAWDVLGSVSGALAFDIGGNQGQAARVLAQNFDRVVSLEPCAESFAILADERGMNVTPLLTAASSHVGEITLTECEGSMTTGQLTTGEGLAWGRATGCRTVPATTIDALIGEYGVPDFIKIDTEGHEVEVLKGYAAPHTADVLIEVHAAANEKALRELWGGEYLHKLMHDRTVGNFTRLNHFWLSSVDVPNG